MALYFGLICLYTIILKYDNPIWKAKNGFNISGSNVHYSEIIGLSHCLAENFPFLVNIIYF